MFPSFKAEKGIENYFKGGILDKAKLMEFAEKSFNMEDLLISLDAKREDLYKDFLINPEKWNKGVSLNYLPGWAGVLFSYNKEVCLGMENIALRSEKLNEFIGKSAMIIYLGEKLNKVIESDVKDIDEYKNILSDLNIQEEMILKERAYNDIEYPKPTVPFGYQSSLGYDESLMDRFLTFTFPLSSKLGFEKSGNPNLTKLFRPYWEPEDSVKSLLDKFVFKNLNEFTYMDRPFKKWKYSKLNYQKWIDIWSKEILERIVERSIPKEEHSEENILLKTYTDILDCFIDYSGNKDKNTSVLNKKEVISEENIVVNNNVLFEDLDENFSEWSLELASSLDDLIRGNDFSKLENSYFNKKVIIKKEETFNEVKENLIYDFNSLSEKVIGFQKLSSLNETVKHLFDYFYNNKETLYLTRDWEGGYSEPLNEYANIGETEGEELMRYLYESNNKEENIFETLYEGSHQTDWNFIWLWPKLNEFYLKRGWGLELLTKLHEEEQLTNDRAKLLDMIEELFFLAPKDQKQHPLVEEPERVISLQGEEQQWINELKDKAEKGVTNKDLIHNWNAFIKQIDSNLEDKELIEAEEVENFKTDTTLEAMQQFLWEKSYKNNIKGTYYKTYKELFPTELFSDEETSFSKVEIPAYGALKAEPLTSEEAELNNKMINERIKEFQNLFKNDELWVDNSEIKEGETLSTPSQRTKWSDFDMIELNRMMDSKDDAIGDDKRAFLAKFYKERSLVNTFVNWISGNKYFVNPKENLIESSKPLNESTNIEETEIELLEEDNKWLKTLENRWVYKFREVVQNMESNNENLLFSKKTNKFVKLSPSKDLLNIVPENLKNFYKYVYLRSFYNPFSYKWKFINFSDNLLKASSFYSNEDLFIHTFDKGYQESDKIFLEGLAHTKRYVEQREVGKRMFVIKYDPEDLEEPIEKGKPFFYNYAHVARLENEEALAEEKVLIDWEFGFNPEYPKDLSLSFRRLNFSFIDPDIYNITMLIFM